MSTVDFQTRRRHAAEGVVASYIHELTTPRSGSASALRGHVQRRVAIEEAEGGEPEPERLLDMVGNSSGCGWWEKLAVYQATTSRPSRLSAGS